jgi:hypothetical protein
MKEQMEMVQEQHKRTATELTAMTNKCLTLMNDLELAKLAESEFEMVAGELKVATNQLEFAKDDVSNKNRQFAVVTRTY